MITFRSHIISLVSVFLALAVGVVLGAGPLTGHADTTPADRAASAQRARTDLRAQVTGLRSTNTFSDEFATTVAPGLIGDRLRGHVVDLVVLPSARPADVSALKGMVGTAGGSVGGTLLVDDRLVDAGNKQLVDELGSQLEARAGGLKIPGDAAAYERIGSLIGRAIATRRRGGDRVDTPATSILAALDTARLLSAEGKLGRRGDLALFVAGAGRGSAGQQRGSGSIVTTLVQAVDAGSGGVVLAGPPASARAPGEVKAVREDAGATRVVSTVDALGRTAGQVVTVMALAGQATGRSGQYGAVQAADGAMPGAHDTTQ